MNIPRMPNTPKSKKVARLREPSYCRHGDRHDDAKDADLPRDMNSCDESA
jgi:hypothetical protein